MTSSKRMMLDLRLATESKPEALPQRPCPTSHLANAKTALLPGDRIAPLPGAPAARPYSAWTASIAARASARTGYLPQEPHFYGYLTAREALRFTCKFLFKGPAKAIVARPGFAPFVSGARGCGRIAG
jgi:hypothetical protein